MRILTLHPDHSMDYSSNIYWVLGDSNQPGDLNTLVDVGSSHPGNLDYLLGQMRDHSKGIGKCAVEQVLITHAHYDHIGGLPALLHIYQPSVYGYSLVFGVQHPITEGSHLRVGDRDFTALHTPGHSEDSVCFYCEEDKVLFSGDTLFRISDTAGHYPEAYRRSLERLLGLDLKVVYPGHGEPITRDIRSFIAGALDNVRASRIAMPDPPMAFRTTVPGSENFHRHVAMEKLRG